MKIYQSRSFEKKVKKLNNQEKQELDNEIKKIVQTPSVGTEKKGDLRGIFVHKLTLQRQLSQEASGKFFLPMRQIGTVISALNPPHQFNGHFNIELSQRHHRF